MDGFCNAGEIDNMLMAFEAYKNLRKPDAFQYKILLKAFADHGDLEKVLKYYEEMKSLGLSTTSVPVYNALVQCKYQYIVSNQ
jgi:pentatricopeptide repeat protein